MNVTVGTSQLNLAAVAELCGGVLVGPNQPLTGLSTDSRSVFKDAMFLAIRGERADGHAFIRKAMENGCSSVLCERLPQDFEGSAVVVPNTIKALGILASFVHASKKRKTVAVTGSVGKTTTKDCICAVLEKSYATEKTQENHNSNIGMPMDLLAMRDLTQAAVLEMGMNALGEIEEMSDMVHPDVAVITNIGSSHVGLLGSRENICKAKLEIVHGMSGGTLLLNGDEPLLSAYRNSDLQVMRVGIRGNNLDYRAVNLRYEADRTTMDLYTPHGIVRDLTVDVLGDAGVWAMMNAFAVGDLLGVKENKIREGLKNRAKAPLRQDVHSFADLLIMEDCYNASPESMKGAVDILNILRNTRSAGRKVAVLGDMYELGDMAPVLHREVGRYLCKKVDELYTIGSLGAEIARGAMEAGFDRSHIHVNPDVKDNEATGRAVVQGLTRNDVVLFKASRGVNAEEIVKYVENHYRTEYSWIS